MPTLPDAKSYIQKMTTQQRGNNSSLAAVLQAVGVKCSPCMQSKLRSLATKEQREQHYNLLRLNEDQKKIVEESLAAGK